MAPAGTGALREGRGSRLPLLVVLGFPVALFLLAGVRAVQLAREGEVPAQLRDLDCDGKVGYAEWLRGGIDFRLRASPEVAGCSEIYEVKTGRAVVLRCPDEPRCRRLPPPAAPRPAGPVRR